MNNSPIVGITCIHINQRENYKSLIFYFGIVKPINELMYATRFL